MPLRLMPLPATTPLAQPATSLLTPLWTAKRPSAHAVAREEEERAVVERLEAEETRRLGGRGRADGERQEAGDARG